MDFLRYCIGTSILLNPETLSNNFLKASNSNRNTYFLHMKVKHCFEKTCFRKGHNLTAHFKHFLKKIIWQFKTTIWQPHFKHPSFPKSEGYGDSDQHGCYELVLSPCSFGAAPVTHLPSGAQTRAHLSSSISSALLSQVGRGRCSWLKWQYPERSPPLHTCPPSPSARHSVLPCRWPDSWAQCPEWLGLSNTDSAGSAPPHPQTWGVQVTFS